jgi:hypothetical protein
MAFNFNLPARGEPLDLTLMSQMATYLNEITQQLLEQRSATSSLEAPARLKVETDNVTIWTGQILVAQGIQPVSNPAALPTISWGANFDISFRSIPVVTATAFGRETITGNSCWLYDVSTTGCKGKFKFYESPKQPEDIYVMVTAIGEGVV